MNSEQLFLELGVVEVRVPWDGRSPRELTTSYKQFILKAELPGDVSAVKDPLQLELFGQSEKGGDGYAGAPLLIPLTFYVRGELRYG